LKKEKMALRPRFLEHASGETGQNWDFGSCLAAGYKIDRRGNEKLKEGGSGRHLTGLQVQYDRR
jgi:hypothetical protein